MVEPTRRLVEHAYFTKRVLMEEDKESRVAFSLTLTQCPIGDEQMEKLLTILDKAAGGQGQRVKGEKRWTEKAKPPRKFRGGPKQKNLQYAAMRAAKS